MAKSIQTEPGRITVDRFHRLAELATVADPDRETIDVEAPFSGELLGSVPAGTAADVTVAVEEARSAQQEWRERPIAERAAVLDRLHDLVLDRQDELLDMLQLESGKARLHAFEEVADVAVNARYYANRAEDFLGRKRRDSPVPVLTRAYEYRHPVGVVGLITPWNYPLALTVSDAIPALVAGNAVVLNPSTETPFTGLLAKEFLRQAGLPRNLFQVVTGRGSTVGGPLIEDVDFVGFTGSTATGRVVAEQAGRNLIDCSMELGGHNPMLVLDDADPAKAVDGAVRGCFTNAGQLCISAERLYVQSGIYDEFLTQFVDATESLTLGTGFDYDVDVGSLVSADQLEKVTDHVEDARTRGAAVLAGGEARPDVGPYFYEPTILADVTDDMAVGCEETFGPVVTVHRFDQLEAAIRDANDSPYGLNGSIWSEDTDLAHEIAPRIACGTVNINEAYATAYATVDAPMGGMKDSGIGRRHGREGITKYTQSQTVAEQRFGAMGRPPGVPSSIYARVMTGLLRVMKRLADLS